MGKRWLIVCLIVLMVVGGAWAAPKPRIRLRAIRDLSFGYLSPGQAALTVDPLNPAPGTYPAQLSVDGDPWTEFGVILPDLADLRKGQSSIPVSGFTTDLPNNQGRLNELGEGIIQIGATVGPVPLQAQGGSYSTRVTVTVYYLY